MHKIEVYQDKGKTEWRWRILARNGNVVCSSSEGFSRRAGALRNLERTQRAINAFFSE
jgi:uncharacterized protein YegP (UPF0339 family)